MLRNSMQQWVCSRQWRNETGLLTFCKQPPYMEIRMQELEVGLTSDLSKKGSSINSVARGKEIIG